jgi:hypothetical protein
MRSPLAFASGVFCLLGAVAHLAAALVSGEAHVWETQEIIFQAATEHANPYVDVDCWIDLTGPGFAKRIRRTNGAPARLRPF